MFRSVFFAAGLAFLIASLGRLIPHPANVTPLTSLAIFTPLLFNRRIALGIVLCSLLVSDLCLSYILHISWFGSWSLFTYSGLLGIVCLTSTDISKSPLLSLLKLMLCSTFGYWIWTNFGTWLLSSLYQPHSLASLSQCYVAGLPFLRNALAGNAVYMLLFSVIIWRVAPGVLIKPR
jgi:hypothetical protein